MSEIVFLVEDAIGGGLVARALGHFIHNDADSYDELRQQVRDAVRCHFDASERPAMIRLSPVGGVAPTYEGCCVGRPSVADLWTTTWNRRTAYSAARSPG